MDARSIWAAYQQVHKGLDVPSSEWIGWPKVLTKLGISPTQERQFDLFCFVRIHERQARELLIGNLPSDAELSFKKELANKMLEHRQASQVEQPAPIADVQVDALLGAHANARVLVGHSKRGARILAEREQSMGGKRESTFHVGTDEHDAEWLTWGMMCTWFGATEAQALVTAWDDEEVVEEEERQAVPVATQVLGVQVKDEIGPQDGGKQTAQRTPTGKVPVKKGKGKLAPAPGSAVEGAPKAKPASQSAAAPAASKAARAKPTPTPAGASAQDAHVAEQAQAQQVRQERAQRLADIIAREHAARAAGRLYDLNNALSRAWPQEDHEAMDWEPPPWRSEQALAIALGLAPPSAQAAFFDAVARARDVVQGAPTGAAAAVVVSRTPAKAADAAGTSRAAAAPDAGTGKANAAPGANARTAAGPAAQEQGDELEDLIGMARELRQALGNGVAQPTASKGAVAGPSIGRKRPTPEPLGSEDEEGPPARVKPGGTSLMELARAGGSRSKKVAHGEGADAQIAAGAAAAAATAAAEAAGAGPSVTTRSSQRRVLPQALQSHPHPTEVRPASPVKAALPAAPVELNPEAAGAAKSVSGVPEDATVVPSNAPQPASKAGKSAAPGQQPAHSPTVQAASKRQTRSAGPAAEQSQGQELEEPCPTKSNRGKQQVSTALQQASQKAGPSGQPQETQTLPETQLQAASQQQLVHVDEVGPVSSSAAAGTVSTSPPTTRGERRSNRKNSAPKRATGVNAAELAALHAQAVAQSGRRSTRSSHHSADVLACITAASARGVSQAGGPSAAQAAAMAAVQEAETIAAAGDHNDGRAAEGAGEPDVAPAPVQARGRRGKAQGGKASQQGGAGEPAAATEQAAATSQLAQQEAAPQGVQLDATQPHPTTSQPAGEVAASPSRGRSRLQVVSRPGDTVGGGHAEGGEVHEAAAPAGMSTSSGATAQARTTSTTTRAQRRAAAGLAKEQAAAAGVGPDLSPVATVSPVASLSAPAAAPGTSQGSPARSGRTTRAAAAAQATTPGTQAGVAPPAAVPLATMQESQFDTSHLDLSRSRGYVSVADVMAALLPSLHKPLTRTWVAPAFPLVDPLPEAAAIAAELERVNGAQMQRSGGLEGGGGTVAGGSPGEGGSGAAEAVAQQHQVLESMPEELGFFTQAP